MASNPSRPSPYPNRSHRGPIIAENDGWSVRDCETCGWAHLDPIPDAAELALMYERTYYQTHHAGWLDKDRSEQAYWDLEHGDKIADWSALLGQTGGRLLDVGCSGGLLIEYALGRGWHAEGIEPSSEAAEAARANGLTVHACGYEDVELEQGSFDVVHSKLLGEHLTDPRGYLAWAAGLLREGGIATIQIPNDFNRLQIAARDALGKHDWWVAYPFHINYFGFESLERLFESAGFVPVARDATFPVEWFLLMGEDYVGNPELGSYVHSRRMSLETHLEALGLRRPLHAHLAEQGIGREAVVHARRP
jgi:SAM-dependent methyltransferase